MTYLIIVLAVIVMGTWAFLQQEQFGKAPSGARLEQMKRSPNYSNGAFQNLSATPALTEGASYYQVMKEFFLDKKPRLKPSSPLPSQKADLKALDPKTDVLVWFGHSSYFMQIAGKKILVDPVFSGSASPISFTTRAFPGADVYTVDDMPEIDYLFITHDHYDHLDHKTVKALKRKVRTVITGMGTGGHLERWGYDSSRIKELDWHEEETLGEGFKINTAPARHFSGRTFKRNGNIWMSFVLTTPGKKIYIGGDSGYDTHFAKIGEQYGPFDLVLLENGQYDKHWKYIHMQPEEVVQAATDLKAKKLFAIHWGKFALSKHPWDEPIIRTSAEAARRGMPLIHPMIGELVQLDEEREYSKWWEQVG